MLIVCCEIGTVKQLFADDKSYTGAEIKALLDKLKPLDVVPSAFHDRCVDSEINKRIAAEVASETAKKKLKAIENILQR